ncbi:PST family polysaccharide transporter [Bacteroides zoogleoformans]|uniref:O-antigen translocase n=1 Tax=Bacteroides zoogleoformans TaxID=28119 RepID=A0ABM6T6D8_9BACE|nr:O-antigen translocase [Bacteroides zoogleoformans]AVM52307.1 O-antigen translocase [Bacteroides zoogleoformans]TWJ11318.1 PST family polysaccharide transporter [Bacteroides zoogleoformans]
MSDNTSSYRSIFKATSLFGGVQFYQILIQIIKSKVIAILLGPAGVGVLGLFQSGLQLVQQITNMGLASSAVRDVSEANGSGNLQRISKTVTVVRRLVRITGVLGLLGVVFISPLLSKSAFGNYDYSIPFVFLSFTLLFDQLSAGQKVVLQGLRRLKELAKCSAIGITIGLLVSIPFYYWLGINGIAPTLVLTSLCSLVISWLYSRKIKIEKNNISLKQTFSHGRQMLVMGISMSISGILATAVAYITRSYIQSLGGVGEVGLYQAGFMIMTTYVGLVMNAIATDYYPRLASINKDNNKCRNAVCQQGEIGTLILAPLLTICLLFMPFVLEILYSDKFLSANLYISWACLGMLLRLGSWVISYLFVAKAESKLFMLNEVFACSYGLIFNILGYKVLGLEGVGIAFALTYFIYFIQVYVIARNKYSFEFSIQFVKCYGIQLLFVISSLVLVLVTDGFIKYLLGSLIIFTSLIHGIMGLNHRIDILTIIKKKNNDKR